MTRGSHLQRLGSPAQQSAYLVGRFQLQGGPQDRDGLTVLTLLSQHLWETGTHSLNLPGAHSPLPCNDTLISSHSLALVSLLHWDKGLGNRYLRLQEPQIRLNIP